MYGARVRIAIAYPGAVARGAAVLVLICLCLCVHAAAHPHYLDKDTAKETIKTYRELLKQHPDEPDLYSSIGDMYVVLGELESAEKYYRKALTKASGFQAAYIGLAKVEYDRGNFKAGLKQLDKIDDELLAYDKNVISTWFNIELGKYDEAEKCAEKALQISDFFPDAWMARGLARRAAGKKKQAMADMDKSLGLGLDVMFDYAWFKKIMGKFFSSSEQIRILKKLLKNMPEESPTAKEIKKDIKKLKKK